VIVFSGLIALGVGLWLGLGFFEWHNGQRIRDLLWFYFGPWQWFSEILPLL
jgi:hypothetical protein